MWLWWKIPIGAKAIWHLQRDPCAAPKKGRPARSELLFHGSDEAFRRCCCLWTVHDSRWSQCATTVPAPCASPHTGTSRIYKLCIITWPTCHIFWSDQPIAAARQGGRRVLILGTHAAGWHVEERRGLGRAGPPALPRRPQVHGGGAQDGGQLGLSCQVNSARWCYLRFICSMQYL